MYEDGKGAIWERVGRPRRDCMCYLAPPTSFIPNGMRKSPDISPRRLSDISPQLRQLKYLVVDEAIKEEMKSSRSVEDINSASIEERILRITGYYGYQPWRAAFKGESLLKDSATLTVDGQADGDRTDAEPSGSSQKLRCCLRVTATHLCKALWGVAVVTCVCSTWTGCTQLAKVTFRQYKAPFTLTWFAGTWNCLFFPLYYMAHLCRTRERLTPQQCFRECYRIFGGDGLTVKVFMVRLAPFGLLWTLTHYLYLQALCKLSPTDASALFCCNKAFMFLLSWIVLRDRFMGVRIVAAIFAIAGIVMMTYADGFQSRSVIAISLAVASASTSAIYKVLFKMIMGCATFGEMALCVSILGAANFIFVSLVPVILYFTGVEHFSSPSDIPWGCLCGVAGLLLVFNLLVTFGIAITYPVLISLGTVLSVPVNALVDLHTCEIRFHMVRVIAMALICLGFVLLLLPEDWDQSLLNAATRLRRQNRPAEGAMETGNGTGLSWSRKTPNSVSSFRH